jgi:hypothetical protein
MVLLRRLAAVLGVAVSVLLLFLAFLTVRFAPLMDRSRRSDAAMIENFHRKHEVFDRLLAMTRQDPDFKAFARNWPDARVIGTLA